MLLFILTLNTRGLGLIENSQFMKFGKPNFKVKVYTEFNCYSVTVEV